LAKQAGDNWVEALIRLKERVEHGADRSVPERVSLPAKRHDATRKA